MSEIQSPVEMITIKEFAERMKVGRSTVFQWLRDGTLLPGKHYLKIGRIIRFPWGMDLFQKLAEIPQAEPPPIFNVGSRAMKPPAQQPVIDLDYS